MYVRSSRAEEPKIDVSTSSASRLSPLAPTLFKHGCRNILSPPSSCVVLFSDDTQRASDDGRETDLLLRRLSGDEEPPERNEDTDARADAERTRGANLIEDGAPCEATEEEDADTDDLVVTGDDTAVKLEELRVRHELAPDGREHDCT